MTIPERALNRQAELVVEVVRAVRAAVAAGQPADATLSRLYREHPEYGSRDRHLLSDTVFALFRWLGWLTPERAPDDATACVLASVLDSEALPPAMALVAKTTSLQIERLQPAGGLPLSQRAPVLAAITGTPKPTLQELVPAWVLEQIDIPPGEAEGSFLNRLIEIWQTSPPTWLRVPDSDAVRTALQASGLDALPHPRLTGAVRVRRGANLWGLPRDVSRVVEIQDLASQAVGKVCAPRPREEWWDVCTGSGGKALHLAAQMRGRGTILATDIRESILEQLRRRQTAGGARTLTLRRWDGLNEAPPDATFDGILLDAPCSGLGTWHRNPDARWRMNAARVKALAETQAALLRACAPCLRPGGTLVYATCTLTRQENNAVIAAFLAERPEFTRAPFVNPLDGTACEGQLTILPWDGPCNGMFVVRLTRR